ncbi:unnamed protein product, partial [Cercopithifilaria johnstoni]
MCEFYFYICLPLSASELPGPRGPPGRKSLKGDPVGQ